jgi:restriction system protein
MLVGVAAVLFKWWLDRRFPSLFRRWLSREKIGNALHAIIANAGGKSALDELSWREFEQLVGESFRRRGFSVKETRGGGADGGVDIVLSRGTDRYFVQCKQWKARQVGVASVRELYGVMAAGSVAGGYVVTSGVFTEEARRFAEGREIELIAGDRLVEMIRSAQGVSKPALKKSDAPICPQCGSRMYLKTARKGTFAGKPFWGCSTFPNCHGKRPA